MPVSSISHSYMTSTCWKNYRCSRCRKSQLLVHNVIFPEGNDEEHPKETRTEDEGDKSTKVFLWFRRQQIEPVHGRDSADGKNT